MCNCTKNQFEQIDQFIDSLETKEGALIEVLHHAQGIYGYLPQELQLHIAKALNLPPANVYGVVSFYSYFTSVPKGKYKINVCLGTVCFVKGSDKILEEFEKQLGIKSGETTEDLMFSIEGLRCVGACGLAPVVVVNEKVFGQVKPEQVCEIIDYCKNLEAESLNC